MTSLCFLACYVCGKPIGNGERLHRITHELDVNGFGAVEACHLECDLGRLTELDVVPDQIVGGSAED